jgi:hypothetical protein
MCLVGAAARLLSHTMDSVIGGMLNSFFAFFFFVPNLPLTPPLTYHPYLYLSLYVLCAAGIFTVPFYGVGEPVRKQKKVGAPFNIFTLLYVSVLVPNSATSR